ncbi:MAG TPA: hypothetical protein VM290_02290 [Gaiellaceae bacterium]|jgi:hypothetical protein|nr:hypothetical protein [Gaiellaceae bacterium]
MKLTALAALVAAAAVPAAALAETVTGTDRQNAARSCKALQTSLGATAFKETYGTNANRSNAFGRCVSTMARAEAENRQSAQAACAAERADANFAAAHGGKTFAQHYGTGKAGANAFGRCVSGKTAQASAEDRRDVQNAARRCAAERKSLGAAAFVAKYGTRANAFGKCVSKLAQGSGG